MKFTLLKTNVLLINKYKLIVLFLTTKYRGKNELYIINKLKKAEKANLVKGLNDFEIFG